MQRLLLGFTTWVHHARLTFLQKRHLLARMVSEPIDLKNIKVYPLAQRQSLSSIEKLLVDPDGPAPPVDSGLRKAIDLCASKIADARKRKSSVMLIYGAHLIKNGALRIVNRLAEGGWVTHLATNGAGTIHDWELSF